MTQTNLFEKIPDVIPAGTQKSFYNTIHSKGAELKQYKADAKGQEKKVLKLFQDGSKLSALEVCRRTGLNHDAGKRATSVLKNKNVLTKLSKKEMIREEFGKMNHLYQLTTSVSEESLRLIELDKLYQIEK